MRYLIFILVSIYSCASVLAQDTLLNKNTKIDSNKVERILFINPHFYTTKNIEKSSDLDTLSTIGFQNRGLSKSHLNLGNVGSPTYNLVFNVDDVLYNDYTRIAFQTYPYIPYIKSKKPITYAEYQTGSAQEQLFKVFHSQTFKELTDIFIGMDKINSKGFYQNQAINNTHFYSTIKGISKNNNYQYLINYDYSKILNQLNGGIFNDSDFTNNRLAFNDKGLLQVNLNQARQTLTQHLASFNQTIQVSEKWENKDSILHDLKSKILLTNDFYFTQQKRLFYDTSLSSTFYEYYNFSNQVSRDSINYRQAKSNIGIKYYKYKKNIAYNIHPLIEVSVNNFRQLTKDTTVTDLELKNYFNVSFKKLVIDGTFNYLLNDVYVNNDFQSKWSAFYVLNKKWSTSGGLHYSRERPQLDVLSYEANNISWSNRFNKTEVFNTRFSIRYFNRINTSMELFSSYTDIKNPIFFNLFRQPQQIEGVSQVIQTGFNAKLKLKKWNFENQTVYQYTGGYEIIKIPQLHTNLLAEYTFGAFKNKMDVTVGTSIRYYSKFEAPLFDPTTNQFYLADSYEVGNYPFVDVFLKARIQRFKILIQSTHVNQGLMGSKYFYFPHYPANDRMFKVALSWLFLN